MTYGRGAGGISTKIQMSQSPTWRNKSMELLITKSELPVFNCLKYTALMEHIDDRHISRETSSQISLARSNSVPCTSRRPTWKFNIFAPKSSQTMSPYTKLNLLCSFPIIHFDAFTKNSIWWHSFVAEVKKHRRPRAADPMEDLESFVSWHWNRVWRWVWRS